MVDGDGPVGQRGRGLGQHIAQRAGGVDPPAGMPAGCGWMSPASPRGAVPGSCAPPRVSKTPGFGLYRGQLLGEVWTSRIVRCRLVEGPFGRVHGQQLVDLATQPVKAVSGSVTVMVMIASLTSER